MRFWTIWTMPVKAMGMKERMLRTREWAAMEAARKLLPKRVRYWCAMQELARATTESPNIPATPLDYVLKNLDRPRHIA
jgi:hypothetical protein